MIGFQYKHSVFSKVRTMSMPYGQDIFLDKKYKFNSKLTINGITLLSSIKDNAIPVVFFDPQYRGILDKMNYGNEGKKGSRQLKRSNLIQMDEETIKNFMREINRVLMNSGHCFLWIDKFHLCQGIAPWLRNTDLSIVDMIVWDKERMGMGYRTRRQCEYLLVLQKEPVKAKGIWQTRNIRDVWHEKITSKKHPHQKPINLQCKLIAAVSNENDIIIDPCAGSFSVMKSCSKENRIFLGTDLKYGKNKRS